MPTYVFNGGNGGGGGGGGGGPNGSWGQDTGTGKTNPGQHDSMLLTRREQVNIDIVRNYSIEKGHITFVPTARIPKRIVLTTNCFNIGGFPNNTFTYIVDVLLVPISFNMQTCFHLYLDPFHKLQQSWYMGTRGIRDNIILLRRMAIQGMHVGCAVEQCDIPEEVRNKTDYRLVVTCPVLHFGSSVDKFSLFALLEMEF